MTQPVTQHAVAKCLITGVVRHILAHGPLASEAALGVDRTTAARWREQADPELATVFALAGVVLAEQRADGASATLAAVLALLEGGGAAGRGEEADAHAMRALVDLAEAVAAEGRAMGDGHVDLDEARDLLPRFRRLQALAGRGVRILEDKLRRGLA